MLTLLGLQIGVMVMVHSDNKGLVLPPRVAPLQLVCVPIFYSTQQQTEFFAKAHELAAVLEEAGVRVQVDDRDNYNPGWKFNHWELKGVPLRMELGPKDFEKRSVVLVRRDTGAKSVASWDTLAADVQAVLADIQTSMLARAKANMKSRMPQVKTWAEFMAALGNGNMVLAPWCEVMECEEEIKRRSGEADAKEEQTQLNEQGEKVEKLSGAAKSLCIPFEQPELKAEDVCVMCGKQAKKFCLFGRSY
jgi:prolyl-tRNA synthetase